MAGKTFSLNSEIKLSLKSQVKLKKSHVFFKEISCFYFYCKDCAQKKMEMTSDLVRIDEYGYRSMVCDYR